MHDIEARMLPDILNVIAQRASEADGRNCRACVKRFGMRSTLARSLPHRCAVVGNIVLMGGNKLMRQFTNRRRKKRNDGSNLESDTLNLIRMFPGAAVEGETLLAGKKVDGYCVFSSNFLPPFKLAVECKDWHRKLTRAQVTIILTDYYSLLDQKLIDQFLLVTKHGLVPNAKHLFDGVKLQHYTFSELADKIMNPSLLVENMIRQYELDSLDKYYIPQYANAPDIRFASSNYDRLYDEFVDFAIAIGAYSLEAAIAAWGKDSKDSIAMDFSKYSSAEFKRILTERRATDRTELESLVIDWVKNDEIREGLALLGSYGTGKSCFARRLAHICGLAYRKGNINRIPFLIELKEFGSHQDIRGLITHELVNRHRVSNGSFELFQSMNSAGRFVLILDGFDEMKQGMTIDSLVYNFFQLSMLHTGRSKVLLCGRPTIFESQAEQSRILKGHLHLGGNSSARFIQMEVTHFNLKAIYDFLLKYTEARSPENVHRIETFIKEVKVEVHRNQELYSLLSRPVHLPMLVSVIPRLCLHPGDLTRSDLYREFINAIIEREMLKRNPEFQRRYSIETRRKFAVDLAIEMWLRGESRSIRATEIPDSMLSEHVRPGYPKEAVRRDMIAACFLERKSPDILYMPHKSFLEYLVAEHVLSQTSAASPKTDDMKITDEVFSFVLDSATESMWKNLWLNHQLNRNILSRYIQNCTHKSINLPASIETLWLEQINIMHESICRKITYYYESLNSVYSEKKLRARENRNLLSGLAIKFLIKSIPSKDDVIAVHAYRALDLHAHKISIDQLSNLLGPKRLSYWYRMGWIDLDEADKPQLHHLLLSDLICCLRVQIHKLESTQ